MKKIDFKNITTTDSLKEMTKEQYNNAVKKGLYYARKFRAEYNEEFLKTALSLRAHEIVYVSSLLKNEDNNSKEIIKSTIIFPDNKSLIKLLVSKGFTYELLYSYTRLFKKIKSVALIIEELDLDQEVDLAIKKIAKLCSVFRNYYGNCDYQAIITKINEIVFFERDLYKQIEQSNKKTK